jgi:tetratricopeptide (TPR) repeat protein
MLSPIHPRRVVPAGGAAAGRDSASLAAADPSDAQAQRDLWYSFYKLGEAERAGKQFEKAIAWYEKARDKVKAMQQEGRLTPLDNNVLSILERLIRECQQAMNDPK